MKIKWFAHASVLFEGNGLRIITDPYTPEELNFAEIKEPADIVVRSSADDSGHNHAEMITGSPVVVTATELGEEGTTVKGIHFTPIHAKESLIHKERPRDNAMYLFTLEGIRIAHLGDLGNPLTDEQMAMLQGMDVIVAPAGGAPTIDTSDLAASIQQLKPKVMIPVHYDLPATKVKMLPVTDFTNRFPPSSIKWNLTSEIELTPSTLSSEPTIVVLKASSTLA